MGYRIVFSDIDGTLLDSRHRVREQTRGKIQELDRGGIPFVLVSARMPSGVLAVREMLEIRTPVICYSGALVLGGGGEALLSVGLPEETAASVLRRVREGWPRVCVSAYRGNRWIVEEQDDPRIRLEREITSSLPEQGELLEPLAADPVHKFLCIGEQDKIEGLEAALQEEFPALTVYRSKATYLEIMHGAASKSAAIAVLLRLYGIPAEASASFGDSYNDADMLRATGYSFAMENAPDAVKAEAKAVTLDNDSEGVLAGLEQLEFAQEP